MFSGEENWPKAGKCELPPSSSPPSSWHTSESFMLKVCLAMLEIPHVQCVKFTPDKESGTFWLHNQCLGFILIQWKCFWFGFFFCNFGNSKRIKIGSWFFFFLEPHKAEFSWFPVLSLLLPICSFWAYRRGAILLGQVISQASVVALKCDPFKVIALAAFHEWHCLCL